MKWTTRMLKLIEPHVGFSTERSVKIVDWKLGLLYYILAALSAVYIIVIVIIEQQYLVSSPVIGLVTPYIQSYYDGVDPAVDFTQFQDEFYAGLEAANGSTYKFCDNSSYNFQYSDAYKYMDVDCNALDEDQIWTKSDGEIFVKTIATENVVAYFVLDSEEEVCNRTAFEAKDMADSCIDDPSTQYSEHLGRCYCTAEVNSFFYGAENLTLVLDHKYTGKGYEGTRPLTTVRRKGQKDTDYEVFEEDEFIFLPIYRILEIAGVDLDSKQTSSEMQGTDADGKVTYPYVRVTGVIIELTFYYGNRKTNPNGHKLKRAVEGLVVVDAVYAWSSSGNDVIYDFYDDNATAYVNQYSYGISIKINVGGQLWDFDFTQFVNSLVAGAVILNLAGTVTTLVATNNPFQKETRLYKQAAKLQFNYRKTYARFALNSIRSLKEFKTLDTDGTGYLTRDELHQMIVTNFSSHLEGDDLKVLTEFIFMEADGHVDVARRVGDGRLNAQEWCAMLSEDLTDLETLCSLVKDMPPKSRQALINRFDGVHAHLEEKAFTELSSKNGGPKADPSEEL